MTHMNTHTGVPDKPDGGGEVRVVWDTQSIVTKAVFRAGHVHSFTLSLSLTSTTVLRALQQERTYCQLLQYAPVELASLIKPVQSWFGGSWTSNQTVTERNTKSP